MNSLYKTKCTFDLSLSFLTCLPMIASQAWGGTCQGGAPLLPSRTIWTTGNGLITLEAQKRDGK